MSAERITISFDDLLRFFVKRWKIFTFLMIICSVLFISFTFIIGEEIVVPDSEEYLFFQEEVEYFEDYIDNSILLKIDPMEIPERTIYVSNFSNRILLKDYVESIELWNDYTEETPPNYLAELITWQETNDSKTIGLRVRHITAEKCDFCTDYVIEQLKAFDSQLKIEKGDARIVSDKALSADNLYVYARLEVANEKLENADAGYVIRFNILAALVCGIIFGALVAVAALFIKLYFMSELRGKDELVECTGAKIIYKKDISKYIEMAKDYDIHGEELVIIDFTDEMKNSVDIKSVRISENTIDEICKKYHLTDVIVRVTLNKTNYQHFKDCVNILKERNINILGCIVW